MTVSRDSLQIQINRLIVQLPRLQRENPDPADFYPAFAGLADEIVDAAGPEDYDWAVTKVEAMLRGSGITPPVEL